MEINFIGLGWLGFWIFMAVYVYVDHSMYLQGHNTFFFKHKTEEELRIRKAQISILENQAGVLNAKSQETNP